MVDTRSPIWIYDWKAWMNQEMRYGTAMGMVVVLVDLGLLDKVRVRFFNCSRACFAAAVFCSWFTMASTI